MFERYYAELIHYMSRVLGDRERAQDVVQETYLRVSILGNRPGTITEPRAFLYRTAKNIVIDEWRKKRNKKEFASDELAISECEEPLTQILSEYRMGRLQKTIDELPPRCHEAFILHKFEGYSHKEVAKIMGISVNAVEKHIIRALLSCKQTIDQLNKDEL